MPVKLKALEALRNFGGSIPGFSYSYLVKERRFINDNNKYVDINLNVINDNDENFNIVESKEYPGRKYLDGYWYGNLYLGKTETKSRLSLEYIAQKYYLMDHNIKEIIFKGLKKKAIKIDKKHISIDENFENNPELQIVRTEKHKYNTSDVEFIIEKLSEDVEFIPQKLSNYIDNRLSTTQIKKIRKIFLNSDKLDIDKYINLLKSGKYIISSIERQAQYDCKLIDRKRVKKLRKGPDRKENVDENLKSYTEKLKESGEKSYSIKKSVSSKKDKLKRKAWNEGKTYKEVRQELKKDN